MKVGSKKESRTVQKRTEGPMADTLVQLLSGEQELIVGAKMLSSVRGELIFATNDGELLRAFRATDVAFATSRVAPASLNVWI
jgi:hypothetical protein